MRKLLVTVVVLLALLLVADRVTVRLADTALAARLQDSGRLQQKPSVDITGFPFLTQAVQGRYARTEVHVGSLTRSGLTLQSLDVTVVGARVPLSKLGSAKDVPVEDLRADAVLTYYELAAGSGIAGLTVKPSGDQVALTGKVAGIGLTAKADVALKGDRIVVSSLGGRLDFSVRAPSLPYGLELKGLAVRQDGVHLTASTGPTVLSTTTS